MIAQTNITNMRIDEISFKNFASYGNSTQTLSFDKNKSSLYLVLGGNGYGKSTIANVIVYGLYGKIEDFNLPDLPNRINKNLWVKIKVKCGNKEIEIERGIAPKLFTVTVDGVELDQAGVSNIQDYLENEVFEIPYHVFKNIIILSINDFKSFLTMSPKDKRNIVDKLFGFSIINDMFNKVKDIKKEIKDSLKSIEDELKTIEDSIQSATRKISELEKISADENKDKIAKLKSDILTFAADKKKLDDARIKLAKKHDEIDEKIDDKKVEYNKNIEVLNNAKRKLKLYENKKCPTCESPLDVDFHVQIKKQNEELAATVSETITQIENDIANLKTQFSENRLKQSAVVERISDLNSNINVIKNELLNLSKSIDSNTQFSHLTSLINEFRSKHEEKGQNKVVKYNEDQFLSLMEMVLGDDGVKNLAIKTILPGLNASIAQMVSEMHLSFHIRFDDKFNCIINHLGEDVNPKTLSTGERKKADFIIIIAIIRLLKLRFPQLNILFLDEIFSSVDADGVYSILKILNKVIKENNLNTFVINHSTLPSEIFDKKIEIYKDNGFSKFSIETLN
jgi:DNA repair exonuclease SbcCD ATPase subunit